MRSVKRQKRYSNLEVKHPSKKRSTTQTSQDGINPETEHSSPKSLFTKIRQQLVQSVCMDRRDCYSRSHSMDINLSSLSTEKILLLLLNPFNSPFSRTTWVSRYQNGKTSLDLNEARDDGVLGSSGISWTTSKQSAPCSRQITTPTPHHSIFYRPDALPDPPTNSVIKYWRKGLQINTAESKVTWSCKCV